MKISEKQARSVVELRKMLLEIIQKPSSWVDNLSLLKALKKQELLAKWQDVDRTIAKCALNTQIKAANAVLEGGYETLDQLRRNALDAIRTYQEADKQGNKTTKAGQQKRITELEQRVSLLEKQNMMLVYLVSDLKNKAKQYAREGDESTRALCEKEMREVSAKITFSNNSSLIAETLGHE